jgi:hypothetical protein
VTSQRSGAQRKAAPACGHFAEKLGNIKKDPCSTENWIFGKKPIFPNMQNFIPKKQLYQLGLWNIEAISYQSPSVPLAALAIISYRTVLFFRQGTIAPQTGNWYSCSAFLNIGN